MSSVGQRLYWHHKLDKACALLLDLRVTIFFSLVTFSFFLYFHK